MLKAALEFIASGEAGFLLATLEDIWQTREPQNVPGTWREKPNWRRRAMYALEELDRVPGLCDTLLALDQALKGQRTRKDAVS